MEWVGGILFGGYGYYGKVVDSIVLALWRATKDTAMDPDLHACRTKTMHKARPLACRVFVQVCPHALDCSHRAMLGRCHPYDVGAAARQRCQRMLAGVSSSGLPAAGAKKKTHTFQNQNQNSIGMPPWIHIWNDTRTSTDRLGVSTGISFSPSPSPPFAKFGTLGGKAVKVRVRRWPQRRQQQAAAAQAAGRSGGRGCSGGGSGVGGSSAGRAAAASGVKRCGAPA